MAEVAEMSTFLHAKHNEKRPLIAGKTNVKQHFQNCHHKTPQGH